MQARKPVQRLSNRRDAIAFWISTWFGCGLVPYAPGTAGSIGALPLYLLLRYGGPWCVALGVILTTAVGLWSSHRTSLTLGRKDPQVVCVDEVAGMLLTWSLIPPDWLSVAAGFVLFRITDTVKPWPARKAESLPGGLGIMLDDLFAAAWAIAIVLCARVALRSLQ